jgi:hypothetical protein
MGQPASLDRLQNAALRVGLGAFRTSPIASLHMKANEPSLQWRRLKLSSQYAIRWKSNSARGCVFESNCDVHFKA